MCRLYHVKDLSNNILFLDRVKLNSERVFSDASPKVPIARLNDGVA
jgi:hypothetical protein